MDKKLIIAVILILISYLGITILHDYQTQSAPQLSLLWKSDISNLSEAQLLHEGLLQLRSVSFISAQNSPIAELWAKHLSHPFQLVDKGEYHLEVLIISEPYEGGVMAIFVHHLIHIPSGNSVWELGRTYKL